MQNSAISSAASLIGRIMLAAIFVHGGYSKIFGIAGVQAYMARAGLPGWLVWAVIVTELGGGLLIVLGLQTRLVAFLLAGFTLLAGLLFHNFWAVDAAQYQAQFIHFMKNLAMAGGFLLLIANGAGAWSLDGRGKAT
ncbi:MAG: DoxX family protein [Hyphomicrobiaceae bacterium]|nr:DoxX family protein [Hyphomicrobiaceae bacterium]